MKRLLVFVLVFCVFTSTTASAMELEKKTDEETILYETSEITDIKEIQSRIDNDISDSCPIDINLSSSLISEESSLILKDSGFSYSKSLDVLEEMTLLGEAKSTTQKLKESVTGNVLTVQYVTTYAVNLNTGSGTEDGQDGNSSTGAILYLTTAYEYAKDNVYMKSYFRFTSVNAKIVRYDSSLTFSNFTLRNNKSGTLYTDMYGQTPYTDITDFNEIYRTTPKVNYNYSCNDRNTYVALTGVGVNDGIATAYTRVTVKRGGRTWTLEANIVKEFI